MKEFYSEYAYTKMRYGKYKGRFLKEIPDDYLIWAVKNWDDLASRAMFATELTRRNINWK